MDTQEPVTQEHIDEVWEGEWEKRTGSTRELFAHRLFVEAYPVFRPHIPADVTRITELGAGSGRYGLKFAQDFPQAEVLITDIVPESLALVDRYSSELGLANVKTQKEDVLRLSFPDSSCELVFCDAVIQHIPDADAVAKEMMRVLKPNGRLIISSVNGHNPFHAVYRALAGKKYHYGYEHDFTAGELATLFGKHGGKLLTSDGFYLAYGLYRLKYNGRTLAPLYEFLGKVLNRLVKLIDPLTGRFLSRFFGFEIFIVVGK